jgi:hypothetical protein
LNPKDLREKVGNELQQVEDRVRAVVRDQLAEAKALVQGELVEAKGLLRTEMNEAEEKVRKGLLDAKQAITDDVKQAVSDAKASVRAATIGKVEDLATTLGDKMNDARETLIDTIRNNPVPAAVAGVGLAWLLMNRSKSHRRHDGPDYERNGSRGSVGRVAHQATEAAGQALHQASDTASSALHGASDIASSALHGASDMASGVAHRTAETATAIVHGVGDTAAHLAHQASDAAGTMATGARRGAHHVEEGLHRTLHDNPVAVGVAALAMGAVVGFSLPRTKAEDSLMGAARDKMVRQASDAAGTAAGSIVQATEQTADRAKKALGSSLSGRSE